MSDDYIYALYGTLKDQLLRQYSIVVNSDWESRVLAGEETPNLPPPETRRFTEMIPSSRPKLIVLGKR